MERKASDLSAIPLITASRTNTALAAALATVPEWGKTLDLRAAVQHKLENLTGTTQPPTPTSADQIDAWLTGAIAATDAQALTDRQHRALQSLSGELTHSLDSIVFVHGDVMLTALHTQLADVMKDVATAADKLEGADNANAAITARVEKYWRALPELRARYDNIRVAQAAINVAIDPTLQQSATSRYLDDPLASDLVLANVDQLVPGWRGPDPNYHVGSGTSPRRAPWPTEAIEQLLWIATSDAEPWVPTTDQLDQLNEQRLKRPASNVKPIVIHQRPDLQPSR